MAAGDAVVKGTSEFTEQQPQQRWIRGQGWRTVRVWEGPKDSTKINTLVASLQGDSYKAEEIDVAQGWPTTITALIPGDGTELDIIDIDEQTEWSLEPYDLTKALGTHGAFNGSEISASVLATIDAALKAGNGYDVAWETRYPSTGQYDDYADLRGMGVENWMTFGYVLRKTITCDVKSSYVREYQIAAKDNGKIISWESIGVPEDAKVEKPWVRMFVATISNLPVTAFKSGTVGGWCDVWFAQWMVKPPAIRYMRQGRTRRRQIVQEYLGAIEWSAVLYDGGAGDP